MGIVFRQSVKTSIVVFGGALLGALITWLSTKYIPKQQFGFTRTLTNQAVTLSQLFLLGLSSTLFVFTHRYDGQPEKKKALLTLCLGFPLITVFLGTIAWFALKEQILHHFQPGDAILMRQYFMWLPLYTLLFLYMTILEQYLGSQMKVAISAFMREVLLRVINVVLILLFAFGYISFYMLVTGTVLIYVFPVVIFLIIASRGEGFGFSKHLSLFSKAEYREMASFSWYHFLLSISITFIGTMDILLLPFYDHNGFSSVAVYGVAVYLISLLQMPSKAFLPASFSILTKAFTDNDNLKAKDIFIRSSMNLLIATVGITTVICCNLENAVDVIGTNKDYSGLIPVFLILLAGRIVDLSTGMNDQVLSITNYYKFNFYVSLTITAVLFILIRLLVPHYGMYGAAWSTTLAIIIFNVAKYLFVWKKLDMQPFSSKTLLVIVAALPALAAGYFFPHFFSQEHHVYVHTFIDAAIRGTVIIIVYLLMLLWLKPSKDLEEYIISVRKNKRLF